MAFLIINCKNLDDTLRWKSCEHIVLIKAISHYANEFVTSYHLLNSGGYFDVPFVNLF